MLIILVSGLSLKAHGFSTGNILASVSRPHQGSHHEQERHRQRQRFQKLNTAAANEIAASVSNRFSREEGLSIVDSSLFCLEDYGNRIRYGREAQGLEPSLVVTANDPRMFRTYGEFPAHSTDELVDLALPHVINAQNNADGKPIEMLDLGSGCGRLVFYFALTRGTLQKPWSLHGIEISDILHEVALGAMGNAFNEKLFVERTEPHHNGQNCVSLHLGAAEDMVEVFGKVQLIFSYSTVFKTNGFSQELCAMILDREWSELLANSCQKGCVVITTDRALDPRHGWELLDRLDVDNREVAGSTGFVQVLR